MIPSVTSTVPFSIMHSCDISAPRRAVNPIGVTMRALNIIRFSLIRRFLFHDTCFENLLHGEVLQSEIVRCRVDQRLHRYQSDNFASYDTHSVAAGLDVGKLEKPVKRPAGLVGYIVGNPRG